MSGRTLRRTLLGLTLQVVGALILSLLVGVLWSRADGSAINRRWSDVTALAGVLWLLGAGTFTSKLTTLGYAQWGIREGHGGFSGDDVGADDEATLTPFGSSLIVGVVLFGTSLLIG